MALPPVGAQLIVFGKKYDINKDTVTILDTLAAAGYAAVEGGPRENPAAYRQMLEERGLVYGGSHVSLPVLQDIKPIVEYLRAVGAADVCNSGLTTWDKPGLEDYRASINILNEAGRQLRDEGIYLHYHNHAFEFDKVDGDKRGIDLLLEGLNPEAVDLCLDVAWVGRGGDDPATFMRERKERIGYLHFKDYNDAGWIELGQGVVDFAPIMALLPHMPKVRWVMLEQDSTEIDPLESVAISRKYLRDTFGY